MKIESEKDNTSLLSLFLFTVQEYEAITAHILLPAPNDYSSISDPLGLRDSAIENLKATWAAMYLHDAPAEILFRRRERAAVLISTCCCLCGLFRIRRPVRNQGNLRFRLM